MRSSTRSRLAIAALGLLFLAACGTGPAPIAHRAYGVPPGFGDSDPYDWASSRTPASYKVHGIDASRWQDTIDWAEVSRGGIAFAWLKATEGGDVADPLYQQHLRGAAAAGVPAGAYHFYYLCRPADEQARWFIANVPRQRGALPPVLDIEFNHASRTCSTRPDPETMRDEIRTFQRIVGAHYGQRPVIYTTPDFFAAYDLGQLSREEFWLRSTAGHPSEKYPGAVWSFWQYTGTGRVPGISGNVDINTFSGSPEAWSAWRRRRSL